LIKITQLKQVKQVTTKNYLRPNNQTTEFKLLRMITFVAPCRNDFWSDSDIVPKGQYFYNPQRKLGVNGTTIQSKPQRGDTKRDL